MEAFVKINTQLPLARKGDARFEAQKEQSLKYTQGQLLWKFAWILCESEHGVTLRAFVLYWGGNRFESLSTHHCWALSKSFIPSLVVWSVTQNNAKTEKSNGEHSDLCDLEQVTLKLHYLTTSLQIWYHSVLWGDSIRKGADFEKQNCSFGVHTAELGKLTFSLSLLYIIFKIIC